MVYNVFHCFTPWQLYQQLSSSRNNLTEGIILMWGRNKALCLTLHYWEMYRIKKKKDSSGAAWQAFVQTHHKYNVQCVHIVDGGGTVWKCCIRYEMKNQICFRQCTAVQTKLLCFLLAHSGMPLFYHVMLPVISSMIAPHVWSNKTEV